MPYVHVYTFICAFVHPLQLLNQFNDIHKTWYDIMPPDITLTIDKNNSEMHKVTKWQ
jgi:hypothetical protein